MGCGASKPVQVAVEPPADGRLTEERESDERLTLRLKRGPSSAGTGYRHSIIDSRSNRYSIVDLVGAADPKGSTIPIEEDLEDAELYWNIVIDGLKAPQPPQRPRLIIMYGPPGCGKGKALKQLYRLKGWSPEEFAHLDPDACRMFCREYRLCISGAHAAKLPSIQAEYGDRLVRTEWMSPDGKFKEDGYTVDGHFLALSKATLRSQFLVRKKMLWGHKVTEMTDAFVDRALKAGYNVVYDTMGNEPNRFLRELMRRARSQHEYQVFVCGCFAPWDMVHSRGAMRALVSGRHVDDVFARGEFDKMFPRTASGLIASGVVDTSHHDRFQQPDEEKFKPAPFGDNGELLPGDERFLFDNSLHNEDPNVAAHSITREGGSSPGEHDPSVRLTPKDAPEAAKGDPLAAEALCSDFGWDPSNLQKAAYKPPVALCVEECSAMLNAQTRMRTTIGDLGRQLEQKKGIDKARMPGHAQVQHDKDVQDLESQIVQLEQQLDAMEKTYLERRDFAIAQYNPMLRASVFSFNAAYGKLGRDEEKREVAADEKGALAVVAAHCAAIDALDIQNMEQECPHGSGDRDTETTTLLALLYKATRAQPALKQVMELVQGHVQATCQIEPPAEVKIKGPTLKGVPRCCAKTQEEYAGNYRRLLDLVRGTIVFPSLHALSVAMVFLTSGADGVPRPSADAKHPGLLGGVPAVVCRAKNRISPDFDAETSGGNRDVLLNVWLELPGEQSWMMAELQLHVQPLFDLKHNLHTLYKGARILGALEPSMIEHRGQLTARAIDRAASGVVRYLKCNHASLDGKQQMLADLLQLEDCPLLELSISGNRDETRPVERFDHSLHTLLIASDQQLKCTKLRKLDLRRRGFTGTLPEKLGHCTEMTTLQLGNQALTGPIPRAFKFMTKLTVLTLNVCDLTGEVPDDLGNLVNLTQLSLDGNRLTGPIPASLGKLTRLEHLYLYDNQLTGSIPEELAGCAAMQACILTNNRLEGLVPPAWLEEAKWPKLKKLKFSQNAGMSLHTGRVDELKRKAEAGDAYWQRVLAKTLEDWGAVAKQPVDSLE